MAISYPLAVPTGKGPVRLTFGAESVVAVSESPFSKTQQVYAHQGDGWTCDVELPPLVGRATGEEWVAFLLALNGREGTFLMGDPANIAPRGIGTGTPLVKGASQTGRTLLTDGWTSGQTGILKAGDWLQLGTGASTHLHKVVQDANSDGSGNATLEIWPRLRSSPADNAAIVVASPKGLWRLADNRRQWSLEAVLRYGISFTCVEAQ